MYTFKSQLQQQKDKQKNQSKFRAQTTMHNKTYYLNPFLVLLLALCVSEPIHALAPDSSRVELFIRGVSTVPFEESNGTIRERVVHSYRIPSLVNVEGVMVAVADARYETSNDNSFIETVVKYSVDDGETWKTQIAIKNSRVTSVSRVVDPTVIVKGNKIYILVGRFNSSKQYWTHHKDGSDWDPLLAVGEVTKTTVDGKTNASIKWSKPVSLKSFFPREVGGMITNQFLGGSGTAIVASNGNLVFPIQVTSSKKQVFSMLMYSEDDGKTWKFSEGRGDIGCSEPVILEWEPGRIIINNRLDVGYRLVYETTDMGKTWTEATGTLSRVWGNSPSRRGPGSQSSFVAVTIEGKRVMLFTHPLNFKGRWERDRLHLWVTDNQRIFDVGQVSIGDENSAYSSVLYKDDKLYCLHEINTKEAYSLAFVRLIDELRLIKSVVNSWKLQDSFLSNIDIPSASTAAETVVNPLSGKNPDAGGIPTKGLVGFLSGAGGNNTWGDAYRCVYATLRHAENVTNGFKFRGKNAGAQWPVARQGQNRRYHFVNYAFTLVASVAIHRVPARGTEHLLGLSLDEYGNRKVIEMSYDKAQNWKPMPGSRTTCVAGSWELDKTYQIALTYEKGVGSIYVDGVLLNCSVKKPENSPHHIDASHFFFGSYGSGMKNANCHITVTNVLLYNRVLRHSELQSLFLGRHMIRQATEADKQDTFFLTDIALQRMGPNGTGAKGDGDGSSSSMRFPRFCLSFLLTLSLLYIVFIN